MPLRQLFDHREDDPVRFSVLARPQTRLKYPQYRVPRLSVLPRNIHLLITSQHPPTLHQYPLQGKEMELTILRNFCWVFDGGWRCRYEWNSGKREGLIIKGKGKEMTVPCVEPGEGEREDYK
jgi:hypothetical protein